MEALDDHGGMRHHLMCPISLQPMQDPVTAPTGISYDRRAIERWLAAGHATCPVTGQPLALADLTPNHTLRRLIQSWTWTPRPPAAGGDGKKPPVVERDQQQQQRRPDDAAADEVIEKLGSAAPVEPCPPPVDVLRAAVELASQSDAARRRMVHAGVVAHVLRILVSCATKSSTTTATEEKDDHHRQESIAAVEACLALLRALTTTDVVSDSDSCLITPDVLDALTDVLVALAPGGRGADAARASAVRLLEHLMEAAASAPGVLERLRLRPELFASVTAALRDRVAPHAALRAMLRACPVARNRALIVEAGAAHEAIELELANSSPADNNRRVTTELTMALLADLCACAEGRAAVAAHPAGVAVVSRRLLRASSAAADACAVRVLAAVGGRAASPEVLREMAAVGAVGKLCCVLQADCDAAVKEAARAVLRMHSGVWSGSPCVSAYLLSRYL